MHPAVMCRQVNIVPGQIRGDIREYICYAAILRFVWQKLGHNCGNFRSGEELLRPESLS